MGQPESFYVDLLVQQRQGFLYANGTYSVLDGRIKGFLSCNNASRRIFGKQTGDTLDLRMHNWKGKFGLFRVEQYENEFGAFSFWNGLWVPDKESAFCTVMGTELIRSGEDVFRQTTFSLLESLVNELREYQSALIEEERLPLPNATLL